MNFRSLLLLVCVVPAIGLSMVFAVMFWSSLGATIFAKYLLSTTGCIFEVSKFYALPHFIAYKRAGFLGRAGICLLMFLVLSFISMLAGIYALHHNLSLNEESALQQSSKYQLHMLQVATQEEKVKNMLALAQADAKSGYRQRAKEILQQVGQEQLVLVQLKFELEQFSMPTHKGIQLPGVSENIGVSSVLIVILGALLELTTTFLLYLFRTPLKIEEIMVEDERTPLDNIAAAPKFDRSAQYNDIVQKIRSSVLTPTQRAVKQAAGLGSDTVSDFFKRMIEEGVLEKNRNNRYQLAR